MSRLMALVAAMPLLAGCAVANLTAHMVKEVDKSREPRPADVQPAAAQGPARPLVGPAVARPAETDGPVVLPAEPAPARETVRVEALR